MICMKGCVELVVRFAVLYYVIETLRCVGPDGVKFVPYDENKSSFVFTCGGYHDTTIE